MEQENKIENMIATAIKNINSVLDVNTVIGKPILTEKGSLIPVSKITFGLITGGGEYGEIKLFQANKTLPFAGGNGAVVSVKPMGFLVNNDDKYSFIQITENPLDKLITTADEFLEKATEGKHGNEKV